jgi:hypothetical protein
MTEPNDTQMKTYDQLMEVRRCIDALKDVAQNMPEDDRYCAVLGIITERLDLEFITLMPLTLSNVKGININLS